MNGVIAVKLGEDDEGQGLIAKKGMHHGMLVDSGWWSWKVVVTRDGAFFCFFLTRQVTWRVVIE